MSDFDKEAERERLREKYERDQQKREASERMSDLLLKGATMTNSHCGNCGDPIFRYDGEEFCPTCQQVVTNDEAAAADAEGAEAEESADSTPTADQSQRTDENGDSPAHIEIKEPDGPAVRTGGDEATGDALAGAQASASDANADETAQSRSQPPQSQGNDPSQSAPAPSGSTEPAPAPSGSTEPASAPSGSTEPASAPSEPSQPEPSQPEPPQPTATAPSAGRSDPAPQQPSTETDDDFGAARAALVRTLRTHAQQAEQCDDPRRARDHLAAAREAAEALSALSSSY